LDRNITELWSNESRYKPVKLNLAPGDFVLWDSRTVHTGHPAYPHSNYSSNGLRRLVAYVCMTPVSLATDVKSLIKNRINALHEGVTATHWPHEFQPKTKYKSKSFIGSNIKLTELQQALLMGYKNKICYL